MITEKPSRRHFLHWSGLAVTGTLLAACQPSDAALFFSNLKLEKEQVRMTTDKTLQRFMIVSSAKQGMTKADFAELMALLPAQVASDAERVKQKIQEGPAFVAADRTVAWRVYRGESQEQVLELLNAEPLAKFNDNIITPLLNEEDNGG